MPMNITERQGQFLAFILRFTERHGISPSFDELAMRFGITSPSVNGMIKTLERKGLISRIPGAARTLRVEVAADLLPSIDFGAATHRKNTKPRQQESSPSALAASTAIAVLDTVIPVLLNHGATPDAAIRAVLESAQRVEQSLVHKGTSIEDALAVRRQIMAEASRWQPDGRGVTMRRYIWKPRHS